MEVLNGHHMLLSVYSQNFRMNYGTISNGIPAKLWHDDHRVAVVYERYGVISSGAMVRCSQSCSGLRELWHNFQWSYGTMVTELQ